MRVLLENTAGVVTDITRYVLDGTLTIEDSINVPTLISFQLSPSDNSFQVPKRSSYITVLSDIYASGSGYGSGKVLATGFVTNEPERTFLGLNPHLPKFNFQQYQYNVNVTSDEWMLNCRPVPYIPAFVNQTDSQILAAIADALYPGLLDTTSFVASGTLVPYFQYDPSQTWSDIAKTFADANRYYYKVINKKLIYQPFGDAPLGISYDDATQKDYNKNPLELKTGVVTVPPVNDCTVIGDIEPQTNWDHYFIGDGFSSNFQLRNQVFDGSSSLLLQDDWTEQSFSQGTWIVNDPLNVITLTDSNGNAAGALNVIQHGASGMYVPQTDATYIQAQNGLELGGGINLQHGQLTFNQSCNGIIGALYPTNNFVPGNCLAGFGVTGQQSSSTLNVTSVFRPVNSRQISLVANGNIGPLRQGYVVTASDFVSASFLNGLKFQVDSITPTGNPNEYTIIIEGVQLYGPSYGPTADSGHIIAIANDVLVTASGSAGIVIQPILNGKYVGDQVITQVNHQYLLQTWIGAGAPTRFTRPYTNMTQTATYGGQDLASSGTITFVVTDVNLGVYVIEQQNPLFGLFPAAPAPVVTKYAAEGLHLPPFAVYCLLNAIDLNVSINYTLLSFPPQGYLTVQSLTGASGGSLPWHPEELSVPIVYQLGFGQQNQTAQISQSGEVYTLSFYTDDIPSVGARIRFQSWAAGQSVARVRDTVAVSREAVIAGDDGVRSAIMLNMSPKPRTSAECQAAAAAAILDREYPQFQGTYTVQTIPYKFENLFSPAIHDYPRTGRFFFINSPVRAVSGQNFFVNTVRIQVVEPRQEVLNISLDYGPDLYLEKLLPAFLEREQNLLVPKQTAPTPNYVTLPQVLNATLPNLDNARIIEMVDSLTGNYVVVDIGVDPVTGCEVRSIDSGWGVANHGRIGLFTTRVFTLPRTTRNQTWYLRLLNGSKFSAVSKAFNVQYPLIPSPPVLLNITPNNISFTYNGDIRDIYGIELRVPSLTGQQAITSKTLLNYTPPNLPFDPICAFTAVQPNGTFATSAVLGPPSFVAPINSYLGFTQPFPFPTELHPGDLILVNAPASTAYNGLRVLWTVSGGNIISSVGATVLLNGWGPNGHVGDYEHGVNQGHFWGTDGGTTFGYSNPGNAIDNDLTTYASSIFQHTHKYAGCVWGFNSISSSSNFRYLNINSAIPVNDPSGILVTMRSAGIWYTLNGGTTWTQVYNTNVRARQWDSIQIPPNQDISQVQVMAFMDSHDDMAHYVYDINITEPAPQSNPTFIGGWELTWYGPSAESGVGQLGNGSAQVGTVQLYSRGNFASINSASRSNGTVTLTSPTPHGFHVDDLLVVGISVPGTQPIGNSDWSFNGPTTVIGVPDPYTVQYLQSGLPNAGGTAVGYAASIPQDVLNVQPVSFGAKGILYQRPVFAPADMVFDASDPVLANALAVAQSLVASGVGPPIHLDAYFFNLQWDYSDPCVVTQSQLLTSQLLGDSFATAAVQQNVSNNQSTVNNTTIVNIIGATGSTSTTSTVQIPITTVALASNTIVSADTSAITTILCNGDSDLTVTLPTVGVPVGKIYNIKNTGITIVTVNTDSGGNIDFSPSVLLLDQGSTLSVQWDGSQYWIVPEWSPNYPWDMLGTAQNDLTLDLALHATTFNNSGVVTYAQGAPNQLALVLSSLYSGADQTPTLSLQRFSSFSNHDTWSIQGGLQGSLAILSFTRAGSGFGDYQFDFIGPVSVQGIACTTRTTTTNDMLIRTDHTLLCSGALSGTLVVTLASTGVLVNQICCIKNIGTGSVIVNSTTKLDNVTSKTLTTRNSSIVVQWDGTQWWILSSYLFP